MQFSIAKLLLVTLFVNFLVAASFAFPPQIGFPLLTFIAVIVIPPFIIVGAFNTRGLRQSFFLGAMVAGTPHFIVSAYFGVMVAFSLISGDFDFSDITDSEVPASYLHLVGFLIGALGGLCGMASYCFLKFEPKKRNLKESPLDPLATTPDEHREAAAIFTESNAEVGEGLEAPLPR